MATSFAYKYGSAWRELRIDCTENRDPLAHAEKSFCRAPAPSLQNHRRDPYASFSRTDLLEWLQNWSGKEPRKRRHAYSNLGAGLLGEALAIKMQTPFLDLLDEKVIQPMGLRDTTARLNPDQKDRFMQPRNTKGKAVPAWSFDALAGVGALRSSINDLIRFSTRVIEALQAPKTPLDHAICRSTKPLLGLGLKGNMDPVAQCSGWMSLKLNPTGPRMLHHDGGTSGSSCAIYICPERSAALGILSNNGVAGNLWASTKLSHSNPHRKAHDMLAA